MASGKKKAPSTSALTKHPDPAPQEPGEKVRIGIRYNNPLAEKTHHTISESKRSSEHSRDESALALGDGPETAAAKIVHALTAGQQGLKAFEKVSLAMAGQPSAALIEAYAEASGGRSLTADLLKMFNGNPGPKAGDYLIDSLSHDGIPSLWARLWVVFGDVDRSGALARTAAMVPLIGGKIGNAGDADRVLELFEAATAQERKIAWADSTINKKVKSLSGTYHRRIAQLMEVERRKEDLEQQSAGTLEHGVSEVALAKARDAQLAEMVRQHLKEVPVLKSLVKPFDLVEQGVVKLGVKQGPEQHWQYIGFDAKSFYDDLVAWKSTASAVDLKAIKEPDSKFNQAVKLIPHNLLMGMSKSERRFITELSGDTATSGATQTQVKAVEASLERQKAFVGRGEGGGAYAFSLLTTKVGTRKWRDVATEIKLLTAEQRKEMLDHYEQTHPGDALDQLEADLKTAGMDKETRAEVMARFTTQFGNIGDNYAELWRIVDAGKTTKLKILGSHLNPKKLTKIRSAIDGTARGRKAMKLMYELEDNEYALVRQDTELLAALKGCSDEKTWPNILTLLGMKDESDQLQIESTRELVHQARLAGEANPKRFAIQLDDVIGEEIVLHGVSAGRDKARLYAIVDRAMSAAQLKAREDGSDPVGFLRACLSELRTMKRGDERVEYLRVEVPHVFKAFDANVPIPATVRIKRAKHEGFGIAGWRKVDRQKVQWAFATLPPMQLLKEWSNVADFLALKAEVAASQHRLAQAKEGNAASDVIQREEFVLGELYNRANTFTIGIRKDRRAELKKVGVNAADRIAFEAMVSDKLADAMDDSPEVQSLLDDFGLPYDEFMRAKMKGVDALEMQRHLDSTRQWHMFSTKGSELSDATRVVKGHVTGTERKLATAGNEQRSPDDIKQLRKQGAESVNDAVADRNLVQARFKDMQATFRQRAVTLFKLIVAAIITGVVAAATYGAGTPMAIAIHAGLELGFNALNVLYQYYVLGERDKAKLAAQFALGILESALRILTTNVAGALNVSLLHPDNIPGDVVDWVAPNLLKGMGKVVQSTVMFAPKHIVEQAFHEKDLEKVIKEGEASIVEEALKSLGTQTAGFMRRMLIAGVTQGVLPQLQGGGDAGGSTQPAGPHERGLGQAFVDRAKGGANKDESDDMWNKYQKTKHREAKTAVIKTVATGNIDKDTKKAEEQGHKKALKDARGNSPKRAEYTEVKKSTSGTDQLVREFRTARGDAFLTKLLERGVSIESMRKLSDAEKGSLEEQWHMTPGQLDRELRLAPAAQDAHPKLATLAAGGSIDPGSLRSAVEAGAIDVPALLAVGEVHFQHLALALGLDHGKLRSMLRHAAAMPVLSGSGGPSPTPVPPRRSTPAKQGA
jgi:hypothetical protein